MSRSLVATLAAGALVCAFPAAAGPAQCTRNARAAIEADVTAAEAALTHQDYIRANALALAAIEKIGNTYQAPHALDDTGQRLSLAGWQQQHGDIAAAAAIRVRMARSRLSALTRKQPC
jgi:hypothetical protein